MLYTECFATPKAKCTSISNSVETVATKHLSVVELKLNDGRLVQPISSDSEPQPVKATESAMDAQNEWVSLSTPPRPPTQSCVEPECATTPSSSNITPFDIVYHRLRPNYQSAFFYACESGKLPVVEFFLNFVSPPESQVPEATGGQPSPAGDTTEESMELEVVMVEPPSPFPFSGRRALSIGSTESSVSPSQSTTSQPPQSSAPTRGEHESLVVCSTDEQRAAFLDQACIFKVCAMSMQSYFKLLL